MAATAAAEPDFRSQEPDPKPEVEDTPETVDRNEALQKSYAGASTWLREKYLEAFNKRRQEIMKSYGYEWEPPLTDEQKAEAELLRLLEENPALAERYGLLENPGA